MLGMSSRLVQQHEQEAIHVARQHKQNVGVSPAFAIFIVMGSSAAGAVSALTADGTSPDLPKTCRAADKRHHSQFWLLSK